MKNWQKIKEFFIPSQPINKSLKVKIGFVMWLLLIVAYTLFVINWGLASGLNGAGGSVAGKAAPGILGTYFPDSPPPLIARQATNWAITFGRGIGSIFIGWVIVKITHKNAAVIALALCLFAIPAPFIPNYYAFIIFRSIFAIGGTTLIILLQPVISAYFTQKGKGQLSLFTTLGYPLGMIIALAPFLANVEALAKIREHWQIVLSVTAALFVIPFVLYIVFAQRFDVFKEYVEKQKAKDKAELEKRGKIEKVSMLSFLKKKETYKWTVFYGAWLVAVVLPLVGARNQLPKLIGSIYGDSADIVKAYSTAVFLRIIVVWLILFHATIILGPYTVGLWNRFNAKRKPYIVATISLGVFFWILSCVLFITVLGPRRLELTSSDPKLWGLSVPFFICGFLCGLCFWGIQGVFLNQPHEIPENSPKSIGMQFGFIWGFGYFFFTIALIVISLISDGNYYGSHSNVAPWVWFAAVLIIDLIAPVMWLFMKETKPKAPFVPKFSRKNK